MIFDVPRITEITKNKLTSKSSSVIYNVTSDRYEYYNGTIWKTLGISNHNLLENIDSAPFYHSNQPIKTTDSVNFKNITANESFIIDKYSLSFDVDSLIFKSNENIIAKIKNNGELTINSINSQNFYIKNDGELKIKNILIGNSFGINSTGDATLATVSVNGDLNIGGNLNIQGTTSVAVIETVAVQNPIIKINTAQINNTYFDSDLGFEFNYYDSEAKIGFFGIELENTGSVKYFKLLENANNNINKFSGNFSNLKLNKIIANSISVNDNYGINSNGYANFNSISVNSRNYRTGISPSLNINNIDLANNFYLIYDLKNTSNINIYNGLEGEVFYIRIKSNGTPYDWGNMIKWNNNIIPTPSTIDKYDVYNFVCFGNNLYCGNFSFNHD